MSEQLIMSKGLVCIDFPPKGRPIGRVRKALDESVAESRWVTLVVPTDEAERMRNRVYSAASRAGYEVRVNVFPAELRQGNRRAGTRETVPDPNRRIVQFIARVRPPKVGSLQDTGASAGST